MAQTIYPYSRDIVHKSSNGVSIVFTDVCKTPTRGAWYLFLIATLVNPPAPQRRSKLVKTDGQMPMVNKVPDILAACVLKPGH